jgi:hypothetical protein
VSEKRGNNMLASHILSTNNFAVSIHCDSVSANSTAIMSVAPASHVADRLVVELRLAGACALAEADRVLAGFLPGYNRRFNVAPREQTAVWRKSPVT